MLSGRRGLASLSCLIYFQGAVIVKLTVEKIRKIICCVLGVMVFSFPCFAGEVDTLFSQVEALKIERQGYVLGAELTQDQLTVAAANPMDSASKKVFKFQDKDLNIVADQSTNRVLVMYQQFKKADQKTAQDLVGELFMAYGDPTISAHDKVVYWAWGKKEKFTAAQFDMAKEKKKKLAIIATVKLNSEIKIMDKTQADAIGDTYYIISSDPLLQFYN